MSFLLYTANFKRIPFTGRMIQSKLEKRAAEIAKLTKNITDPDISIVIRSRNNSTYVKQWFEDIKAQEYSGQIEIIVVDTESTDDTISYAKSQGATIIQLSQADFTYPAALNLGFNAAQYDYVVTLVGHSNLSNTMMFKSLAYWCLQDNFGGLYGIPLANKNGSIWERLSSTLSFFILRPQVLRRSSGGMLGANASVVKRSVWEKLGRYDESYAGGGEDAALARSMRAAGFNIVREPLWSLFHSHGLNFVDSLKQRWHWIQVGRTKPQAFVTQRVHGRRPDLRND